MLKASLFFGMILASSLAAQTAQNATIEALLAEVRQLRLALERSAVLQPKMQITLQRLSLQDQKVVRLGAQLDAIRREIGGQTSSAQRAAQDLSRVEQQISTEQDAMRRKSYESERMHLKVLANQVVDPQLLARESELASALQQERAVGQELSERLATMERELDSAAAGANPRSR